MSLSINNVECSALHFTGILGSGMSALAQYVRLCGVTVSGSDRLTGSDDTATTRAHLETLGCHIVPQDGSGISNSINGVVVSTAIEESNPDIRAALAAGVAVFHRSDVLAAIVKSKKTIAIAGTSGKSTVTAMVFEFLRACGKEPSVITGAPLVSLQAMGYEGNCWFGSSDLLVIEADESDGTIVKYFPYFSVILNLSKDHKTVEETFKLFQTLSQQSTNVLRNADDSHLDLLTTAKTFALNAQADFRPDAIRIEADRVIIAFCGTEFVLPMPGIHNAANLMAALSICQLCGCDISDLVAPVKSFGGIKRRFEMHPTSSGIVVIDDYAHNPEKVKAALLAAQRVSASVIAVFQPHGYGPTRFLKDEFISVFAQTLRTSDRLFLLPIYYAGGSAVRDIASEDIAGPITVLGKNVVVVERRKASQLISENATIGDCVLVMGARDPSLPAFVDEIVEKLQDYKV